jgi:hypothetical protein
MKNNEKERVYVAVAGTIQVPVVANSFKPPLKTVVQPIGRQIAQACHVVSKLRFDKDKLLNTLDQTFEPMTTIILQARDSAEMGHVFTLLFKKRLNPVIFSDDNPEYGPGQWPTAVAVFATPKQVKGVLDYLPLWGSIK